MFIIYLIDYRFLSQILEIFPEVITRFSNVLYRSKYRFWVILIWLRSEALSLSLIFHTCQYLTHLSKKLFRKVLHVFCKLGTHFFSKPFLLLDSKDKYLLNNKIVLLKFLINYLINFLDFLSVFLMFDFLTKEFFSRFQKNLTQVSIDAINLCQINFFSFLFNVCYISLSLENFLYFWLFASFKDSANI
jgi:hypothetical protein